MKCPNKNLEDWKLLEKHNPSTAYVVWDKYNGNIPNIYLGKKDRVETNPFTTTEVPERKDTIEKINKTISDIGKGMLGFKDVDDKTLTPKDVEENHKKSISWFDSNDISKAISFERAFHMINSDNPNIKGNFSNSTITLFSNAVEGDLYHEAWHGFTQMYLTLDEKKELYDSVRKREGSFKLYNGESVSFYSATYEQVEEYLAENFKKYMLKGVFPKKTSNIEKSIFKSILNFLKALFKGTSSKEYLLDRNSSQLQNDLFDKLRIGNLSSLSFSEKNMMFKSLNSTIKSLDSKSEVPNITPRQSTEVYNMVNSLFSNYLDYKNKGLTNEDIKLLDKEKLKYKNATNLERESITRKIKEIESSPVNFNREHYTLKSFDNDLEFLESAYAYAREFIGNKYKDFYLEHKKESEKDNPDSAKLDKIAKKLNLMKWVFDNFGDSTNVTLEAMENDISVISYHRRRSTEFLDISEDIAFEVFDTADLLVEEIQKFDHSENSSSMQELADRDIIFLLKSLHEINADGELVYDQYGIPKLEDTRATWNRLSSLLEKDLSVEDIYKTLLKESVYIPIVKELLDKLGTLETIDTSRVNLWTKFSAIFSMPKVPLYQGSFNVERIEDNISITSTVGRAQSEPSKVIKDWNGRFETSHTDEYTYDVDGITYLDIDKVLSDFPKDTLRSNSVDFLNAIGLYIVKSTPVKNVLRNIEDVRYIREHLVKLNNNNLKVTDLNDLQREHNFFNKETKEKVEINSINGNVKNIAALEIHYGTTRNSAMVTNASGDVQFDVIQNNFITITTNAINKAETLDELYAMDHMSYLNPKRNPATKSLIILSSLFDENGNKRKEENGESVMLNAKSISGLFVNDVRDDKEGISSFSSNEIDKWGLDFHMFIQGGIFEMMRHADKKSSFSLGIKHFYSPTTYLGKGYMPIKSFIKRTSESVAKDSMDIFIPKIQAEMERIFIVNKKGPENSFYKNLKGSNKFTMFDGVLRKETKKLLYKEIKNTKNEVDIYNLKDKTILDKIEKDVHDYFQIQIKLVSEKVNNSFVSDKLNNNDKEDLISAFVYNSWIHNTEMFGLIYGDLVQYADFFKRNSGAGSNGGLFRTDKYMLNYINSRSRGYSKRNGGTYGLYDGTFRTAILEDNIVKSIYAEDYIKALTKAGVPLKTAQKYLEMNEADGQGYISFDSYRLLKESNGTWSTEHEELYQKIVKGEKPSGSEIALYFPPMKPHYFGPLKTDGLPIQALHKFSLAPLIPTVIKGTVIEELHNKMVREGIDYVTYDSGSKLGSEKTDNKFDQFYETKDGKLDRSKLSKEDFTPNVIYVNYLKEQFPIASKRKGKTVLSTQKRKLVPDNLFSNGVPNTYLKKTKLSKDQRKEKWDGLSEDEKKKNKIYNLTSIYLNNIEKLTEYKKDALLVELGMERVDEELVLKHDSLEKLLGFVKKTLTREDLTDNEIDFLELSDGALKSDLSLSLNSETIEKLLDAVAINRIVKQKVTGEGLIHVSTSMMENINNEMEKSKVPTEAQKEKYGTDDLPFYYQMDYSYVDEENVKHRVKKTAAMKIKIALSGDFRLLLNHKDLDGNKIGTIARLNDLIKDDKWLDIGENRKLVTLTGERIPVQGLNSIEFMEVYQFLEEEAGSIIITPSEIVIKSGTDFDVDKMTVMMPSLMYKKGGGVETYKVTKEKVDAAYNKYISKLKAKNENYKDEVDFLSREDYETENFNKGKELENNLIDSIRNILELEDNFTTLIRPNDTDILYDIAMDLADVASEYDANKNVMNPSEGKTPTRAMELETSMYKKTANSVGMETLSIGAIDNTYNVPFNLIGMYMGKSSGITRDEYVKLSAEYQKAEFKDKKAIMKKINSYYPQYLRMAHNKTADGSISLSHDSAISKSKSGAIHRISDVINQMINGWVDVAKDSWIFNIQGNKDVASTLLFLVQSGVEIETAIYFVSQPMVREYVKEIQEISSMKTKIHDNENYSKSVFAKRQAAERIFNKYNKNKNEFAFQKSLRQTQSGNINLKDLKKTVRNTEFSKFDLDNFVHFLQVEKMADKITELKRATNFDTKGRKTFQGALESIDTIEELESDIAFGKDMVKNILNPKKSVIGSFEIQKMQTELWSNVLPLRTNKELNKLILKTIKNNKAYVYKHYTNKEQFASEMKREFISYLIQKNLKKGNLTESKNVILDFKGTSSNIAAMEMAKRSAKLSRNEKLKNVEFSLDNLKGNKPYVGKIENLEDNQVFVFGANDKGDHGVGAAGFAMGKQRTLKEVRALPKYTTEKWAIKGMTEYMRTPNGRSYGLVTVEGEPGGKNRTNRISNKNMIHNIQRLYDKARRTPDLDFLIAYRDDVNSKSLNGFTGVEMIELFNRAGEIPLNISFSDIWTNTGLLNLETKEDAIFKPKKNNKTEQGNVIIRSWSKLKDLTEAIRPKSIVSTRINNSNKHFGNPFTGSGKTGNGIVKDVMDQNNPLITLKTKPADLKANVKGSLSNKYIGFVPKGMKASLNPKKGESSTGSYALQIGKDKTNTGKYSNTDVVFASISGGVYNKAKLDAYNSTLNEIKLALDSGAKVLLDNKIYAKKGYNSNGEGKLYDDLINLGYSYSTITKNNTQIGLWVKSGIGKTIIAEAVQAYKDWLTTDKYDNEFPQLQERKQWILEQIESGELKDKPIVYYKELGELSHANVLDELINGKYSNSKEIKKQEKIEFEYKEIKDVTIRNVKHSERAVTPGITKNEKGVHSYNGELIINRELLYKEYIDETYATKRHGYAKVDVLTFKSFEEYENFVIEREIQRIKIPKSSIVSLKPGDNIMFDIAVKGIRDSIKKKTEDKFGKDELESLILNSAYEVYLKNLALDNTYNSYHLFKSQNSIANTYAQIKKKYPHLKAETQFFPDFVSDIKFKDKVISVPATLEDTDIIEAYTSDVIELADPKIIKVDNIIDNAIISDFFYNMRFYSLLQSGIKTSGRSSFARIFDGQTIVDLVEDDATDIEDGTLKVENVFNEFEGQFYENNNQFSKRMAPKSYTEIDNTDSKYSKGEGVKYNYDYEFLTEESKASVYKSKSYTEFSEEIKSKENTIVVYNSFLDNDNTADNYLVGDEKLAVYDLRNKIGLPTSHTQKSRKLIDGTNDEYIKGEIDDVIESLLDEQRNGVNLLFNVDGYGQDLEKGAPKLFEYLSKRLLELGFRNPNFIIENKNYDYAAEMELESYPDEIVISFINSCR